MKYGKFVSVTVQQHGQAYLGDVKFMDELDVDLHGRDDLYHIGIAHKYVSPSSMRRLATAINNSSMTLELDEYGVPTWTREVKL